MPLVLTLAHRADAGRIAEIHMAAFGPNMMLRAQFPTPAVRQALQRCIEMETLAEIDDPKTTVLIVRESPDDEQLTSAQSGPLIQSKDKAEQERKGRAIAFAKWAHPVTDEEDYVEPPWMWPEGTDRNVLENWMRKTEEAQERALGRTPCYRMFTSPFRLSFRFGISFSPFSYHHLVMFNKQGVVRSRTLFPSSFVSFPSLPLFMCLWVLP